MAKLVQRETRTSCKNHRKRLGFMSQKNDDGVCPNCGHAMEPIDAGADGPPLQHLQLCPACYLVTWVDQEGLHLRQGVPVKKGEPSSTGKDWFIGDPKD